MPIDQSTLTRIKNNDPTLTYLDLSSQNPKLTDNDVIELVNALQTNSYLTHLDLKKNEIGVNGAKALARNRTLKSLKLYNGNQIGEEGLLAFLKNTTLIDFPIIGGSGEKIKQVRDHVKGNAKRRIVFATPEKSLSSFNFTVTEFKEEKTKNGAQSKVAAIGSQAEMKMMPLHSFEPEIARLIELKSTLRGAAAELVGQVLSPFKNYLSVTHFNPVSIKKTEIYYRSEKHPLNESHREQKRRYQPTKYLANGGRAHVGDYTNPMQLLTESKGLLKPSMHKSPTTPGSADIYDGLLKYQLIICHQVVRRAGKTYYIQVGVYNQFPCVMVHLNNNTILAKKASDPTIEAWVNLVISYMSGLVNYLAYSHSIPIELVRRSSFGALTPSVAPTNQSIRLNMGNVPLVYADLMAQALKLLDGILGYWIEHQDVYNIEREAGLFHTTLEYKTYIGKSIYHKEIQECKNLLQLLWAKAEKGPTGRPTISNIMRTPYARQKISADVFNALRSVKDINNAQEVATIFSNVLLQTLKQLRVNNGLSFLQEDEKLIVYSGSFSELSSHPSLNDPEFWALQHQIIQRLCTIQIEIPLFVETRNKLEECYKNRKIDKFYFYLETINHCLLAFVVKNEDAPQHDDGYGSDSDTENEVAEQKVSAKKLITHNGMRAIWGTVLGIRAVMLRRNPQYRAQIYAKSAYYEVLEGLKLLPALHEAVGSIDEAKMISHANICIIDLNACATQGNPDHDPLKQLKIAKDKILILDSTSATTDTCHNYLHWIVQNFRRFEVTFFVSSGLKFEQFGADINHYGTIRIFTRDKSLLNNYYEGIKRQEAPLLSAISHAHRRMMKRFGFAPVNSLFFKRVAPSSNPVEKKEKEQDKIDNKLQKNNSGLSLSFASSVSGSTSTSLLSAASLSSGVSGSSSSSSSHIEQRISEIIAPKKEAKEVYVGILDENEIEFILNPISGEQTDCGFIAFGKIGRKEFANALLDRAESKEDREALVEEVNDFISEKESVEFLENRILQIHYDLLMSVKKAKKERDDSNPSDEKKEGKYRNLLSSIDVYKAYVNCYKVDKSGLKLMMGFEAAKLYAKYNPQKPINLYLWKNEDKAKNKVQCIKRAEAKENRWQCESLHMFHTRSGTHYDTLIPHKIRDISPSFNGNSKEKKSHEIKSDNSTKNKTQSLADNLEQAGIQKPIKPAVIPPQSPPKTVAGTNNVPPAGKASTIGIFGKQKDQKQDPLFDIVSNLKELLEDKANDSFYENAFSIVFNNATKEKMEEMKIEILNRLIKVVSAKINNARKSGKSSTYWEDIKKFLNEKQAEIQQALQEQNKRELSRIRVDSAHHAANRKRENSAAAQGKRVSNNQINLGKITSGKGQEEKSSNKQKPELGEDSKKAKTEIQIDADLLTEQEKEGHYAIDEIWNMLAQTSKESKQCLLTVMPELLAKKQDHKKIQKIFPEQIRLMQESEAKIACMVSPGLGANSDSHFITLVVVNKILFVIDPYGVHLRSLEQLEEIKKSADLDKIIISNNKLQTDESSCGPISTEIAISIAKIDYEKISNILATVVEKEDKGISYAEISIEKLLPPSLKPSNQENIKRIRQSHKLIIKKAAIPSEGDIQYKLNEFADKLLAEEDQKEAKKEEKQQASIATKMDELELNIEGTIYKKIIAIQDNKQEQLSDDTIGLQLKQDGSFIYYMCSNQETANGKINKEHLIKKLDKENYDNLCDLLKKSDNNSDQLNCFLPVIISLIQDEPSREENGKMFAAGASARSDESLAQAIQQSGGSPVYRQRKLSPEAPAGSNPIAPAPERHSMGSL